MLTHLSVHNFTLVDNLELELNNGMTAITGETGAGKSITLDALNLTLGGRADADKIRNGKERADICATFDISTIPQAREWLLKNELGSDSECLLRRVITRDGRSRGYINGKPTPISQLREIGELLIDIHSQNAHQSLLKKNNHQRLLDDFSGHTELLENCKEKHASWNKLQKRYDDLRNNEEEVNARLQLLRYQVQELNSLALEPLELESLESEQQQLSSAESILLSSHQVAQLCENEESGIQQLVSKALQHLDNIPNKPEALDLVTAHLQNAQIEIQEAQATVRNHIDHFEADPQRLQLIEDRLSSIYDIARKHRINPEEVLLLHQTLAMELSELESGEGQLDHLEAATKAAEEEFMRVAQELSSERKKAAHTLQNLINEQLQSLAMQSATFKIAIDTAESPKASGIDDLEFLISTNPGQEPRSLAKVASGGELSRISLAIQVVTAQSSTTPTLVFDEVDVGIGGATADTVGKLLRKLGEQGQILCVTHLAQVACKAHAHLQVQKESTDDHAQSILSNLNSDERTKEVARMMGGNTLTNQTLALAKEMINEATLTQAM